MSIEQAGSATSIKAPRKKIKILLLSGGYHTGYLKKWLNLKFIVEIIVMIPVIVKKYYIQTSESNFHSVKGTFHL